MKKNYVYCLAIILGASLLQGSASVLARDSSPDNGQFSGNRDNRTWKSLSASGEIIEKTYPEWVAGQLAHLKEGMTLGEWNKAHPDETTVRVSPYKFDPRPELWGAWCARTEQRLPLPDGKEALRYAFFYPPSPPTDFSLPDDHESEGLLDRCKLGLIWITGPIGTGDGESLAKETARSLGERIGRPNDTHRLSYVGSAYWREVALWLIDSSLFFSAYDFDKSVPLAAGILPISGFKLDIDANKDWYISSHGDFIVRMTNDLATAGIRLREAIKASGIDGPTQDSLKVLFQLNESQQKGLRPDKRRMTPERAVRALGDWLAKADGCIPQQKAAALLAADIILSEIDSSFGISDPGEKTARAALAKLGADFKENHLGGGVFYVRSWLLSAQQMDPNGPIGDLAFRILMENGFDTSGMCQNGRDQFKEVIRRGEEYLKKPFSPEAGRAVELMVAEAYRDIVALAEGLRKDYADPKDYSEAAPAAWQKAIEHFRVALAQAPDTVENRANWSDAWRLIAGLPPAHLRFFCIYD